MCCERDVSDEEKDGDRKPATATNAHNRVKQMTNGILGRALQRAAQENNRCELIVHLASAEPEIRAEAKRDQVSVLQQQQGMILQAGRTVRLAASTCSFEHASCERDPKIA